MAPVIYRADAACPRWEKFLDEIFAGDAEMISYIQRVVGYAITGAVTEKAVWIFHGSGNNGKTTLLKVIREMLGVKDDGYGGAVDINTLMKPKADDYTLRMIAAMQGKRFITASEPQDGAA